MLATTLTTQFSPENETGLRASREQPRSLTRRRRDDVPRTRDLTNADTTLIETLRVLVRDIVREEMERTKSAAASDSTDHLSTRAAAQHAGVAMGTIRRWIREGKLRELRAGRHLRVRRADVDALLAGDRNGPDASPEELARQAFAG